MDHISAKQRLKFPVAVVFYILSVLYSGLNILSVFVQLYREHTLRVALGGVFNSCLSLILPAVIILLLLLRKRNALLFLVLGMQSVFSAITAGSELLRARYIDLTELYYMRSLPYSLSKVLYMLLCIMMLLFAVDCLCSAEKKYNRFLKKIWFLPTVLYALMGICNFMFYPWSIAAWIFNSLLPGIMGCTSLTLLCWWITRPYKAGHIPAQEPSFTPSTPYGTPVQTDRSTYQTWTAFCSRCGKPLTGGDAFCTYCGAPIGTVVPSGDKAQIRSSTAIPVGDSVLSGKR